MPLSRTHLIYTWTAVFLQLSLVLPQLPVQDDINARAPAGCSVSCEAARQKPVCGTDGATYSSRCSLLQAQCRGHAVQVKYRGRCSETRKCWAERALAQRSAREKGGSVYIPVCRDDGRFADVQCHSQTGYCWCVTEGGKPVPGSSVRYKRPNCSRKAKSNTRRRSSRRRRQQRGCSQSDRSAFNDKLIKIFKTEYNRLPTTPVPTGGAPQPAADKRVIEWKFSRMDADADNRLNRKEFRALRRMVVKIVKPRRCARSFSTLCDLDEDLYISRKEWSVCLGVDINNESLEDRSSDDRRHSRQEDGVLAVWNQQQRMSGLSEARPTESGPLEGNDCLTDRRNALDDLEHASEGLYVPECTVDGRYQQIQCYKSAGYCWCVMEDSGRPIPGTSVKNNKPDCEDIPGTHRPMKGCPGKKKTRFLMELIDFLTKNMMDALSSNTDSGLKKPDEESVLKEQVVRWHFSQLDKNTNQILERKEWKIFRNSIVKEKSLKRCGKKLPRYCDVNKDKKISLDEWNDCLGTKKVEASTVSSPSKRRGQNPLSTYLKSDD